MTDDGGSDDWLRGSTPPLQASIMDPTRTLPTDSRSFSRPRPHSYRNTPGGVPPRSSSLMTAHQNDMEHIERNMTELELPGSVLTPAGQLQGQNGTPWARLRRKMNRPRSSNSSPSVSSIMSSDIGEADPGTRSSHAKSIYTPSFTTEEAALENADYTKQLYEAVDHLENDFVSGAREMADFALSALSALIVAAASTAESRDELWRMTVSAAKKLTEARPSMNAAITSCLLKALGEVRQLWEIMDEKKKKSAKDLAAMSRRQMARILEKRKEAGIRLGENFAERLRAYCRQRLDNTHTLTILTLSNSSTIRASILATLSSLRFLHLTLLVLESRPRFEGTSMASQILSSASAEAKARLKIRIFPDCAVGTAAKDAQLVLLGADRISASGDVSNKIGSLAAALCVKRLNRAAQVVVVSDGDKIVAEGVEEGEKEVHPDSEMTEAWDDETRRALSGKFEGDTVEVFGEWFEWVPSKYVDGYVTENGTLDTAGVQKIAAEIKELKEGIFG